LGQRATVEPGPTRQTIHASPEEKLRERDEELAEAQVHLAKMERQQEALEQQVGQQANTLAAQQAEIARLMALLEDCGDTQPGVVARPAMRDMVDQLPKHPTKTYATRGFAAITHLAIHHSAVSATVPVENIARYHVVDLGWPGIGYHFHIRADGAITQTQRLQTVSWHVSQNNDYSVGICVAGDFTLAAPPQVQIDATAHLVAWLMQELAIAERNILGHREFPRNDTSCPGETWLRHAGWKNLLLDSVRAVFASVA
jgi:hypothetical protein